MQHAKLTADIAARFSLRAIFLIALVCSLITNVLLSIKLVTVKEVTRDIFIPPEIKKSFWVDGENLDPNYMEQMAVFLLGLYTNTTPSNGAFNTKTMLQYVSPKSYGEVEALMRANAEDLAKNNASTFFEIRSVSARPDMRGVMLGGLQLTYIADKQTSQEPRTYFVRFGFGSGRIYLEELRSVDEKTIQDFSDGRPVAPVTTSGEGR